MNIYADKLNAAAHRVWACETKPSKQVTGKLKENNMKYSDYMSKVQISAERMKTLREEHGLTMNELAEEIGMAPCNVF